MSSPLQNIVARLSLRKPQRESLDILANVVEKVELSKNGDIGRILKEIRALNDKYKTVEDFEREFPSLCFALATGVGKTRLMGACIAYLYLSGRSKHFMVLAPNLTIYQKLISDFSPNSPKYVFKGISEFVTDLPVIVTAENYETGKGVRTELVTDGSSQLQLFENFKNAHINIFNISKINAEVRSGRTAKIKKLSEYIGSSYFNYLSGLEDLVLIMDEAHRYRGTQGAKAINELNPIVGLEFTATPQMVSGKSVVPFKNVIYNYPLALALRDGFVKEPAVLTRENFNVNNFTDEQLEIYKLKDGIHNHEYVKVQLYIYAKNNDKPVVKPFVLVVAKNIEHASALRKIIESDDFFDGRYKGKVLEIHSGHDKVEEDANIEKLLSIENNQDPTEIVVHVDKLKEGWDVTNLYTVIPLRKADSRTLVEQCIGRGLRLPYGIRVGETTVDRLTIIAHDKFQEIVDLASDPEWAVRFGTVIVGKDIPEDGIKAIPAASAVESILGLVSSETVEGVELGGSSSASEVSKTQAKDLSTRKSTDHLTAEQKEAAKVCLEVIQRMENLPNSESLKSDEVKQAIEAKVRQQLGIQLKIEGVGPSVQDVVTEVIETFIEWNIDIPEIVILPSRKTTYWFKDFDLDTKSINFQAESENLLIHNMRTNERERLGKAVEISTEERLEDYLISELIERPQIPYEQNAELLNKLSGQVIAKLRSYLKSEDEILNVLQQRQKALVELIYVQMMQNYEQTPCEYIGKISNGFISLKGNVVSGASEANFRTEFDDKQTIKNTIFRGFKKCCSVVQKFDSDSERRFAVILEDAGQAVKHWIKPAPGIFRIGYKGGHWYEPDFVVETPTEKFICEIKARSEMNHDDVREKARAALVWCGYANEHAKLSKGKKFAYLLIPHDVIKHNVSFQRLTEEFLVNAEEPAAKV